MLMVPAKTKSKIFTSVGSNQSLHKAFDRQDCKFFSQHTSSLLSPFKGFEIKLSATTKQEAIITGHPKRNVPMTPEQQTTTITHFNLHLLNVIKLYLHVKTLQLYVNTVFDPL